MLRPMLAGLAALCLAALSSAAFAETVRDNDHNFRIDIPSGWKTEKNPNDVILLIMVSAQAEQTGGSCNVVTELNERSGTMTQAELEGQLEKEITEDSWAQMFKSIIFIDNVAIEKTGSERINGHKAYYVLATFNSITPGSPIMPVKIKQYLHAIPGQLFFVTCSAMRDGYATEEKAFQDVFESFKILRDKVTVSEATGVPSLTLYARENFGGVSRVVTQDTPDLAAAGWQERSASISVAGSGIWKVCDGANYAGNCRLISSAVRQPVKAASARRLSPAEGTFGVMLQAAGAQGAAAFQHH